jgi:hypothetical protein
MRGIRSTSVTNIKYSLFVAHHSHAYVRHACRNYCACLNKDILRMLDRADPPVALAMHHGTPDMRSMSSIFIVYNSIIPSLALDTQ